MTCIWAGKQNRDEIKGGSWEVAELTEKRNWIQDNLEKLESTVRSFS